MPDDTLINVARFQNKIRAIMGVRGKNPVPLVKDVAPNITIEAERPEWDWPGGELQFCTFASVAAVAALQAYFVLWNPPGSGGLFIVKRWWVNQVGSLGQFFWSRIDPTTIASFIATVILPRDGRAFGRNNFQSAIPSTFYRGNLTAAEVAAYTTSGAARFPAMETTAQTFDPFDSEENYIIPEGMGFGFQTNQVLFAASSQVVGRWHIQERGLPS